MSSPRLLRRILDEETYDLRDLPDVSAFRRWLAPHFRRWRHDPVFRTRVRIRNLRRSCPELLKLEREHRRAADLDAASSSFARLRQLGLDLAGAEYAIDGISDAVNRASGRKRDKLLEKLATFQASREKLAVERTALVRSSPERQRLLELDSDLARRRTAAGLDPELSLLARLLTGRGRHSSRSGEAFEREADEAGRTFVLPKLDADPGTVRVLRGVTLNTAKVEFDLLLVRETAGGPVEVLAAVEAKRNINDLAHGFRRRQEDLAWLTGRLPRRDCAAYRTKRFPTGRFDRKAVHREEGREFLFGPESFRRFRRAPRTGFFLDRLYLVTRPGPVWGVASPVLSRIAARVATDDRWNSRNPAYLAHLFKWCRKLSAPLETPDILRLYASSPRRAARLIILAPC